MAEQLLHDVLGDVLVDQPRPEGVAELAGGDLDWLAGLVVYTDVFRSERRNRRWQREAA